MKNFRTYDIAKDFYHLVEGLEWPLHLRDQARRAASNVVLNVEDGADSTVHQSASYEPCLITCNRQMFKQY